MTRLLKWISMSGSIEEPRGKQWYIEKLFLIKE